MNRKNKVVALITVGFFVFLIIFTWLSKMVYAQSLTRVTVSQGMIGALSRNFTEDAIFSYVNEEYDYLAPVSGEITQVFVEVGDLVRSSEPLYQYDLGLLQLQVFQNQLAIVDLENQNDDILPSWRRKRDLDDDKRIIYDMNNVKISRYEEEIERFEALIDQGGLVTSQHSGEVSTLLIENYSAVQKGKRICQIIETTKNAQITWTMPADNAQYFEPGHQLKIPLQIWSDQVSDDDLISKTEYFDLRITDKEFESESDSYLFTIDIQENLEDEVMLNMNDKINMTIDLQYKSQEYDCIVPRSAVVFEGETDGYVYCLREREKMTGLEQYAQAFSVEVLDMGDEHVAITEYVMGEDIVIVAEKAIEDGEAVRVIQ